jgi:hypothetical protein
MFACKYRTTQSKSERQKHIGRPRIHPSAWLKPNGGNSFKNEAGVKAGGA